MQVFDDVFQLDAILGQPTLIVRSDHLCLVDTGEASDSDAILDLIAAIDQRVTDLKHILITHSDEDHIGGLQRIHGESGALVYASPHEADVIEGRAPSREGKLVRTTVEVDVRVHDGDRPVGDWVRVVETPGHTAGHVSYYLEDHEALITGDCLNNVSGLSGSMPEYTLDASRADSTVRMLAAFAPESLLFGHGPPVVGNADELLRALARGLDD